MLFLLAFKVLTEAMQSASIGAMEELEELCGMRAELLEERAEL